MRIAGAGHAGAGGARQGDLYVELRIEPDDRFGRQGTELITRAEVPVTTAIVGGEVFVPTLEGEVAIEVPAGTQHGDMGVLSGRGLPPLRGGRRGDQHVVFELVVPTDLDEESGRPQSNWPRRSANGSRPGVDDPPRGSLLAGVCRARDGKPARARPERARGGARPRLGRVCDLRAAGRGAGARRARGGGGRQPRRRHHHRGAG